MKPANTIELHQDSPDQTQAVAVRQPESVSLFRTDEPQEVVKRATSVATALRDVIEKQGLISDIRGKKYPKCEAWTLCGTMLGIFPVLCWSRPVDSGWEARVEARTRTGEIVGAAEAQCLNTERNWSDRDDFAVRSMAQTRATAKALRMPLGFIMTLAGYEATPECEMPGNEERQRPRQQNDRQNQTGGQAPPTPAKPAKQPVYAPAQTRMKFLHTLNAAPGEAGEPMMKAFCVAAGMILDTESVIDLPLRYVPIYTKQVDLWKAAIDDFESGGEAVKPFVNEEAPENLGAGGDGESRPAQKSGPTAARGSTTPESKAVPENRSATAPSIGKRDPEWFFDAVCPVPRKGMKREEYMKEPDTIGSMYEARHDDEYLRKRLFGLMQNFEAKGWTNRFNKQMPPSKEDIAFREALDAFAEWAEKKGERI
jgi:hypothetical protein